MALYPNQTSVDELPWKNQLDVHHGKIFPSCSFSRERKHKDEKETRQLRTRLSFTWQLICCLGSWTRSQNHELGRRADWFDTNSWACGLRCPEIGRKQPPGQELGLVSTKLQTQSSSRTPSEKKLAKAEDWEENYLGSQDSRKKTEHAKSSPLWCSLAAKVLFLWRDLLSTDPSCKHERPTYYFRHPLRHVFSFSFSSSSCSVNDHILPFLSDGFLPKQVLSRERGIGM